MFCVIGAYNANPNILMRWPKYLKIIGSICGSKSGVRPDIKTLRWNVRLSVVIVVLSDN